MEWTKNHSRIGGGLALSWIFGFAVSWLRVMVACMNFFLVLAAIVLFFSAASGKAAKVNVHAPGSVSVGYHSGDSSEFPTSTAVTFSGGPRIGFFEGLSGLLRPYFIATGIFALIIFLYRLRYPAPARSLRSVIWSRGILVGMSSVVSFVSLVVLIRNSLDALPTLGLFAAVCIGWCVAGNAFYVLLLWLLGKIRRPIEAGIGIH